MKTQDTLWRHTDFMRLWMAQTISVFGSQFSALALPLIAAITLRASPGEMGILSAVETAPFLLIGLFAGVWVDRVPRRPVLIAGDLGRAAVLGVVVAIALAGALRMPHLYVLGFLMGILTVFFDVAYQAYLPALVSRGQLVEGNSKLEASRSTAQLTGPGVAGAVIQAVSASAAIALDALSFLASGALIGTIRTKEERPAASARASMWGEIREGLGLVVGNRLLRSIAGCTGTANFFSSAVFALFILFATRELKLTPAALGLIFSLGNVAGLAGALTAGRLGSRLGIGRAIVLASFVSGLGMIPIVVATPDLAFPLLVLGALIFSFGNPVYNINQVSLRQAITALRLQGRMNATMRFLVWGTMPLGGLVGGALGELLGLRPAMIVGAIGGMLAFLWVFASPVRALERIPEVVGEG